MQKPPVAWLAITSSFGSLVIALLVGYIFHATVKRIVKVEDDYQRMIELKKRAEAADVAKSQVIYFTAHNSYMCYCCSSGPEDYILLIQVKMAHC
jgi:histidine kinase 2/3/4 (cytokinin receptor)